MQYRPTQCHLVSRHMHLSVYHRVYHVLLLNAECSPHFMRMQVLELGGVGVGVRHTRRICVHNPTANDIEFECWPAEAPSENAATAGNGSLTVQPFRCLTPCGRILACKKTELIFEYTATHLGACERLWTFSIPCTLVKTTMKSRQ